MQLGNPRSSCFCSSCLGLESKWENLIFTGGATSVPLSSKLLKVRTRRMFGAQYIFSPDVRVVTFY